MHKALPNQFSRAEDTIGALGRPMLTDSANPLWNIATTTTATAPANYYNAAQVR